MNRMFRLLCLFVVPCLMLADARAESVVLSPIDALVQTSIYGQTDDGTGFPFGPPDLQFQYWTHTTAASPQLSDSFYSTSTSGDEGSITSLILLYDLRGLSAATLSQAVLTFNISQIVSRGSIAIGYSIGGSNSGTLNDTGSGPGVITAHALDIPVDIFGDYFGILQTNDLSGGLSSLLNQGFDYASVYLNIDGNPIDYNWPVRISFSSAPTLNVNVPDIAPSASPVPEPSTIVQLGISIVGLGLYALRGKSRAR